MTTHNLYKALISLSCSQIQHIKEASLIQFTKELLQLNI